jgi:hypothetical protein
VNTRRPIIQQKQGGLHLFSLAGQVESLSFALGEDEGPLVSGGKAAMIDALDIFAFAVFAIILAAVVILIVFLGSLPGNIARKRGHPQATAITAAGWLSLAGFGVFWPLALIWAFLGPGSAVFPGLAQKQQPRPTPPPGSNANPGQMTPPGEALEPDLPPLPPRTEIR